jgi:hypothetical protein
MLGWLGTLKGGNYHQKLVRIQRRYLRHYTQVTQKINEMTFCAESRPAHKTVEN